jgi:hypothetical protein
MGDHELEPSSPYLWADEMTLSLEQIDVLETAMGSYAFPARYYDFAAQTAVDAASMIAVESYIRELLLSAAANDVRNGLANVIYWGYAQIGYQQVRVRKFLDEITVDQINAFQALISTDGVPSLSHLSTLHMPQFSGISFLSKVVMFLDPSHYCVLDLQLAKLGEVPGTKALHRMAFSSQIRVTRHNQAVYDTWRGECLDISRTYLADRYRAVDVERGFFHLIQTGQLDVARQIYAAA